LADVDIFLLFLDMIYHLILFVCDHDTIFPSHPAQSVLYSISFLDHLAFVSSHSRLFVHCALRLHVSVTDPVQVLTTSGSSEKEAKIFLCDKSVSSDDQKARSGVSIRDPEDSRSDAVSKYRPFADDTLRLGFCQFFDSWTRNCSAMNDRFGELLSIVRIDRKEVL
jgi:hypothetical protein